MTKKNFWLINFVLLAFLILSIGVNQIVIAKTNQALGISGGFLSRITKGINGHDYNFNNVALAGDLSNDAIKLVISKGVPEIYGEEMGVSFDQVQGSINVMRQFDPTYGKKKITLTGDNLKRYIDIGLRISCEYCCGAKAIIRGNGDAACGCAHSQAMRGLSAYLIANHGDQYSNDEILRELARWKGMYFPKQMIKKMASQLQSGKYTPDTASLILNMDLPDYGSGSKAPLPSDIENLPSMVGGC